MFTKKKNLKSEDGEEEDNESGDTGSHDNRLSGVERADLVENDDDCQI